MKPIPCYRAEYLQPYLDLLRNTGGARVAPGWPARTPYRLCLP